MQIQRPHLISSSIFAFVFVLPVTAIAAEHLVRGCFERSYPAIYLNEHPGQSVRHLTLRLYLPNPQNPDVYFGIRVKLSGHRQVWNAGGPCHALGEVWRCQPDTDGASVLIVKADSTGARLENPGKLEVFYDKTGPGLNTRNLGGAAERVFLLRPVSLRTCSPKR